MSVGEDAGSFFSDTMNDIQITVCVLDKTFKVSPCEPSLPKTETVGMFGYCKRFDSAQDFADFAVWLHDHGFNEE